MKATDLMIGDWVNSSFFPYFVRVIEIIKDNGDYGYVKTDGENDIVRSVASLIPIPLTAEILEKNEFALKKEYHEYDKWSYNSKGGDGYIRVELFDMQDGEWGLEILNYDKFADNQTTYKIEKSFLKVHELQHALRLCGIDKEITLL